MSDGVSKHPALRAPLSRGDFGCGRFVWLPSREGWRGAPGCVRAIFASLTFAACSFAAVDPAQFAAAKELFETKKLAEAQQAFEKLAAADPKDAEVNFHLGELALRRDDAEKAMAYFEKATAAGPNVSRYQRRLGDAYGRAAQKKGVFGGLGLGKKCLASYQRAVELDPKDVDARNSLFDFYRMAPGFAGGNTEKALAEAAAIKQLDPARGRIAFATFYIGEKKYDRALAEFDAVLKMNPVDYTALYQVGRLAALTGQFVDRGIASLRRCLELPVPTPTTPGHAAAQWRLGNLLEKKSDLAGARAAYQASLKLDPNFTAAAESLRKLK